jgi:nitrite reductase/ring-hydroxylating ferredoxin subunit
MITEICNFNSLPYKFFSFIFNDEIIIYELKGELHAISGFCPHFGGPLQIKGERINCHWHDWDFDSRTHKCINKRVNISLTHYRINRISTTEVIIENAD